MCGAIDHFKVKYPRARQRGSGDSETRGNKGSKGADGAGLLMENELKLHINTIIFRELS